MKKIIKKYHALIIPIICLLFIILGLVLRQQDLQMAATISYIIAFIIGGYRQAIDGLTTLFKEHDLDVDLLMVVAAIGAGCIGYWNDGALLIFIFSLSGALEELTQEKTNQDIEKIIELRPETAVRIRNDQQETVLISQLEVGDTIRVLPGEKVAADGKVAKGYSSIDQSMITGESIPVDVAEDTEVFAGTINLTGALEVTVVKPAEETMLAQIIQMVQEAQSETPPNQLFIEKFERIYARIVILAAILVIIIPPLLLNWTWETAVYRGMVFLVVASPCALVASIMPGMLAAISKGTREGLLFKGGVHVENAGLVKAVAFDKTGTLTEGNMQVTDIIPLTNLTPLELLARIASVESLSDHPIAQSIVAHAAENAVELLEVSDSQVINGKGIQGTISNETLLIGKRSMLPVETLDLSLQETINNLESQGKTVILCASEKTILGVIALEDSLRPESLKAISILKEMGIATILLTGDNQATAEAIGKKVGIDRIYANLLPDEKSKLIHELKQEFQHVAMIGDGINDAPALAVADVGVAMGIRGTDVALETANVVLLSDEMTKIPEIFSIGKKANRIIKQNIIFAMSVIILLIISNFFFHIQLPIGVVGHEGSTLLVILNGMRLLR